MTDLDFEPKQSDFKPYVLTFYFRESNNKPHVLSYSFHNYQLMASVFHHLYPNLPHVFPQVTLKANPGYHFIIYKYLSKFLYKTRIPISKQNYNTIIRLVSTIISQYHQLAIN